MAYSQNKMHQDTWWKMIITWIAENTLQIGIIAAIFKGIDKAFRYASESRDERIRRIVREELDGKFQPTEDKIDHLTKLVYERLTK